MTLAAIMQPLPIVTVPASSAAGSGLANLLTPHPREAFVAAQAGATSIVVDLGAATAVDTVFLGYTNLPAGLQVTMHDGADAQIAATTVAHTYRRVALRHAVAILPAPIVTRQLRITVNAPAALVAGVVAAGVSIRPQGFEYGSGRPIIDTSQVERLFDGAFGIDRGKTAGGWQWTMPGLTDEERDRLYALALDVGVGGTILVVEDTDGGPGANERVHWGLLSKLEPYTRQAPGENKWTMQIGDWA